MQKLLYYCYADYLCQYKDKLFDSKICAFDYGPIIEDAFTYYEKKYSGLDTEEKKLSINHELMVAYKTRITSCKDGINKITSIDKTLEKYKNIETSTLVDMTHRKGTPWDKNYNKDSKWKLIPTADIIKYHSIEE